MWATSVSNPLEERQLWNIPTPSTPIPTTCPPKTLHSGGILTLDRSTTVTLTRNVIYHPNCTALAILGSGDMTIIEDHTQPFYASTSVLIYVVATTTVIAWFLMILLMIVPSTPSSRNARSFRQWLTHRDGRPGLFASQRPIGSNTGSRPWLQKLAALLVAIALTVASADAFKESERQYSQGIMNAQQMRDTVVTSIEIRTLRVVSDIFLWLAQIQTLIRLFPRQKEKLIIKWFGFLLITLDTVFSCLNSFYVNSGGVPRRYGDAIPALSYLFQLALSLLYAAWVLYYITTKRRYAFWSSKMPSIAVVALFAVISIMIPACFFVADIAQPNVSGWGDFFRWVAGAAASIVVWEWVERIESLERDEKKDGILGREVFDEDEMPNLPTPRASIRHQFDEKESSLPATSNMYKANSGGFTLRKHIRRIMHPRGREDTPASHSRAQAWITDLHSSFRRPSSPDGSTVFDAFSGTTVTNNTPARIANTPQMPNIADAMASSPPKQLSTPGARTTRPTQTAALAKKSNEGKPMVTIIQPRSATRKEEIGQRNNSVGWEFSLNPFKRRKRSPPLEVKQALKMNETRSANTATSGGVGGDAPQAQGQQNLSTGWRQRYQPPNSKRGVTQVRKASPTVIPAPPRGHAWSPELESHSPVQFKAASTEQPVRSLIQQPLASQTPMPKPSDANTSGAAARDIQHAPSPVAVGAEELGVLQSSGQGDVLSSTKSRSEPTSVTGSEEDADHPKSLNDN